MEMIVYDYYGALPHRNNKLHSSLLKSVDFLEKPTTLSLDMNIQ